MWDLRLLSSSAKRRTLPHRTVRSGICPKKESHSSCETLEKSSALFSFTSGLWEIKSASRDPRPFERTKSPLQHPSACWALSCSSPSQTRFFRRTLSHQTLPRRAGPLFAFNCLPNSNLAVYYYLSPSQRGSTRKFDERDLGGGSTAGAVVLRLCGLREEKYVVLWPVHGKECSSKASRLLKQTSPQSLFGA